MVSPRPGIVALMIRLTLLLLAIHMRGLHFFTRPPSWRRAIGTRHHRALGSSPADLAIESRELPPNWKDLHGIVGVQKPIGWSSADVVARIKGMFVTHYVKNEGFPAKSIKKNLKVGHGGTLDPGATGVLVIGLGRGCKTLHELLADGKTYRAVGLLGAETDTLDSTGKTVERAASDHVTEVRLPRKVLTALNARSP